MIRPHEDFSSAKSEVQRMAESPPSRASEFGRTKPAGRTDDLMTELAVEGFHLTIFGRLERGTLVLATASGEITHRFPIDSEGRKRVLEVAVGITRPAEERSR